MAHVELSQREAELKVRDGVCIVVLAVWSGSPSRAMAWHCDAAEDPADFVICSDSRLLTANGEEEQALQDARRKVGKKQRKSLADDERAWNLEMHKVCGLPLEPGKPSTEIIFRSKECVLNLLVERTTILNKISEGDHGK